METYRETMAQIDTFLSPALIDYRWWIIIAGGLVAIIVSQWIANREWKKVMGRDPQWDDDYERMPEFDKRVTFVAGLALFLYGLWLLDHGRHTAGMFSVGSGLIAFQNWWEAHTQEERDKLNLANWIHSAAAMAGGYFAQKWIAGDSYFEKAPAFMLGYFATLALTRLADVNWMVDVVLSRIEWRKQRAEARRAFYERQESLDDAKMKAIIDDAKRERGETV